MAQVDDFGGCRRKGAEPPAVRGDGTLLAAHHGSTGTERPSQNPLQAKFREFSFYEVYGIGASLVRVRFGGCASGRSHKEACSGCMVLLATPTRSALRAWRSVSSRNRAPKAARVFAASYFLR